MDWIRNLCGCLPLVEYLNSSHLARQTIEEEQCTEQVGPDSIYVQAKEKSFNFMKLQQTSDDEEEQANHIGQPIIDVCWYPDQQGTKWEHYQKIAQVKHRLLLNVLREWPPSSYFDKMYDSQDELQLVIYSGLRIDKKRNIYRFSFKLKGTPMSSYTQWLYNQETSTSVDPHLKDANVLERDPNDGNFVVHNRRYQKFLVVQPHRFIVAIGTKTTRNEDNQQCVQTACFSVRETQGEGDESLGQMHLCGLVVRQTKTGLTLEGYLDMELQTSVSPYMLRQPLAKNLIRPWALRVASAVKKTDQI